jgi:hypothetical protein
MSIRSFLPIKQLQVLTFRGNPVCVLWDCTIVISWYLEISDTLSLYKYIVFLSMFSCIDLSMLTNITKDQTQISFNLCLYIYTHVVTKSFQKAVCICDRYQTVQTYIHLLLVMCYVSSVDVSVCMYVGMHVYIYVCVCVCVCVCTHTHTQVCMCRQKGLCLYWPGYLR